MKFIAENKYDEDEFFDLFLYYNYGYSLSSSSLLVTHINTQKYFKAIHMKY